MHGAAVFFAVLLASKKARINRLLTNDQSIEVCSEQPFTHSCSNLQSMYGVIVYTGMLEAPKFARSNIVSLPCSEHRSMHGR